MPQFNNRDEWEASIKRELVNLTEPQVERLMKLLGDPPSGANVPESFWNDLGADLTATLQPALLSVYIEGAQQLLTTVPKVLRVDWHLVNEPAAAWAQQWSGFLVDGITATSQDKLQNYVSSFFRNEGTTVDALRGQIGGLFGPVRAELIATTEVTRAAAQGDIGIVNEIEAANPRIMMVPFWDTSMDEWVCDICGPRHGNARGKGWTEPPPAHVRCRCGLRWEPQPRGRR